MSIIFDTSIWIEYFKGKPQYFDVCQQLLEKGEVKTIEILFAELLQGTLNKREVETIRAYFELVPKIGIDHLYLLAGEYSKKEKLISKGIGLIDSVIIIILIIN
jgi:predicted nucleic acid-binding protein